jgi:hypothetical protein
MPSSKTTVLGIRLDHERRGWIEAEAARQGVSIRTYFEHMIDEARSTGHDPMEPEEPIAPEPLARTGSANHDDIGADPRSGAWPAGETDWIPEPPLGGSTVSSTPPPGLCDDLLAVAAIPCRVLREARELPRALINVATRPFRRHGAF